MTAAGHFEGDARCPCGCAGGLVCFWCRSRFVGAREVRPGVLEATCPVHPWSSIVISTGPTVITHEEPDEVASEQDRIDNVREIEDRDRGYTGA